MAGRGKRSKMNKAERIKKGEKIPETDINHKQRGIQGRNDGNK